MQQSTERPLAKWHPCPVPFPVEGTTGVPYITSLYNFPHYTIHKFSRYRAELCKKAHGCLTRLSLGNANQYKTPHHAVRMATVKT
jgi:hypothetical protein